jgi:LacI family transcriptional regulator
MGYLPNATARALKTKRSQNIGVLFVDTTHSGLKHEYFSSILDSLKVEAERLGYDLTFISKNIGKFSMSYYEHTRYRNCDGVVIASVDFRDPDIISLVQSEIPTVTLDYVFEGHSAILSDNTVGMTAILDYVYAKGHRDIALIHGEDTEVTRKRVESFYASCARLGLTVRPECVKAALYHAPASSAAATRELLALDRRPTCVLFPDDYSYTGGMNEIESRGLAIPEDISVVGYDGISLSRLLRPRLVTFKQDAERMGREAASQLIAEIEGPEHVPARLSIPGVLLTGESVAEV